VLLQPHPATVAAAVVYRQLQLPLPLLSAAQHHTAHLAAVESHSQMHAAAANTAAPVAAKHTAPVAPAAANTAAAATAASTATATLVAAAASLYRHIAGTSNAATLHRNLQPAMPANPASCMPAAGGGGSMLAVAAPALHAAAAAAALSPLLNQQVQQLQRHAGYCQGWWFLLQQVLPLHCRPSLLVLVLLLLVISGLSVALPLPGVAEA
jgi:hypothetical protein